MSRRAFVATGVSAGAAVAGVGAFAGSAARAAASGEAAGGALPPAPRAAGRPMPELERPLADSPERRLGWAVVGLGDFALNHMLPALGRTRHCRLTAVVSGNAEKARAVAAAYGVPASGVYSYDDFDRIRDDRTVDVVYVVLPNALHAAWTERAARAGKHVFCEKPMAVTEAECRRMIDACARAGRRLMIAYRAPFEPHNAEAIRMLRAGEAGAIREIVADHGRPLDPEKPADRWRAEAALAGGGSLYDIGIYSLNGARYLTGEDPVEVRATYRKPPGSPGPGGRPIDVEQGIAWTMRFPGGAVAHCTSGYDFQNVKRIQVMAERASLALDPATEYEGNRLIVTRERGREEPKLGESSLQFVGELDEFASAIRENREPRRGTGPEGLHDVRIMQRIYEAARTGRPVEVPPAR
ncbi:Gfo/Idh/MocA family oxidoreductase [Roseisolibacter sp. H3M3-2]|uniref:Gfo/Idh/MocA family protein n=1 Tax=Roseisolibacter sp. H3M3-2 TaxID=3031323 RepID=UPI0023DACE18|nr:Gfo/Idh/MocA family oxidoreductase [Roseisolibacter sp. H3M3-2]MDF1505533.1 Gfo/Idh/MocA family oxidoreductase [Roseisolibacter sp. H3M3-2]